jgi:hypothetical protein
MLLMHVNCTLIAQNDTAIEKTAHLSKRFLQLPPIVYFQKVIPENMLPAQ